MAWTCKCGVINPIENYECNVCGLEGPAEPQTTPGLRQIVEPHSNPRLNGR